MGDVYADVEIGDGNRGDVLVIQHPCSMRNGATQLLVDSILVAVISDYPNFGSWSGSFQLMPLPKVDASSQKCAANFNHMKTVKSSELTNNNRIAVMTIEGVSLLIQRLTNYMTRTVVGSTVIEESIRPQYTESELAETWIGLDLQNNPQASFYGFVHWINSTSTTHPGSIVRRTMLADMSLVSCLRREIIENFEQASSLAQAK
jgi:hypothetical protein